MEIENEIRRMVKAAIQDELQNVDVTEEDDVLTAQEAIDLIGGRISYSTIMRECKKGSLPCFKIGSKVFIRKSRLMHWIEDQERNITK